MQLLSILGQYRKQDPLKIWRNLRKNSLTDFRTYDFKIMFRSRKNHGKIIQLASITQR
jgi:hypothetical protein